MKKVFIVIITAIITITGTAAAYSAIATDVIYGYGPNNNVDDALKDLYTKSKTYKKLTTATSVVPTNLLSGKTAYSNTGSLVTGVISTDCVSGSFTWTQNYVNNGYVLLNYVPSYVMVESKNTDGYGKINYYNASYDNLHVYEASTQENSFDSFGLNDTILKIKTDQVKLAYGTGRLNKTIYYMACR